MERIKIAKKFLVVLAGSDDDAALLAKHVAGYNNRTTDAILADYKSLPVADLTKGTLETKARLLAPFAQCSRAEIAALGFGAGKSLWRRSAKKSEAGPISGTTDARGGRKRHAAAASGEIQNKWIRLTYEGSREGRVFYGTERNVIAAIKSEVEAESGARVSASTIRKHRPGDVRRARRPTDLCPICEQARRLRIKLMTKHGSLVNAPAEAAEGTQTHAKNLFAGVDKSILREDPDFRDLIDLQKHEDLAARLHGERYADVHGCENTSKVVCVADWAGKVTAKSHRGTAAEFFGSTKLEMLGMLISIHDPGGARRISYVHAYDVRKNVVKNGHRTAPAIEEILAEIRRMYRATHGENPKAIDIWMDTCRHFRNKVVMYHMVVASQASKYATVRLRWFAEYHGKSILDATFRRAREWISEYVDYAKAKKGEITMEVAIEAAYKIALSANPTERYKVMCMGPPDPDGVIFFYGRRALKIADTDCIHELSISGDKDVVANLNCGKPRVLKIEWVPAKMEDGEREGEPDGSTKWSTKQEKETYVERIRNKFKKIHET